MQSPMGCAPSSSSGCSPLYPDPTHPLWEVKSGSTPTGPPPGGGHISWVLTRPSWSAHLWMPTRMLTFVSRSHLPSWEAGSGCAPGRHLLHPLGAHLCFQIPLALMGGWIWMRARPSPTASSGCSPLYPDPSCPHGKMDLDAHPAATQCVHISLTWPLLPHIAIWLTTAWLQWRWAGLASCHTTALTCYQTATQ